MNFDFFPIILVPPVQGSLKDVTDSTVESDQHKIENLLPFIRQNLGSIFLLSLEELEVSSYHFMIRILSRMTQSLNFFKLLADMDVEKHSKDAGDKDFCIRLRDTCGRIVSERQEAKEAMDLLQMWKAANANLPNKRARHSHDQV